VRRLSATLLLALFGFSLMGPAVFASDPESNLPACCRRSGKHHCAIGTPDGSSSGPALQAGTCPSFPSLRGVTASSKAGLARTFTAVFAWILALQVSQAQIEPLLHISSSLAGQKRGPPLSRS